MNKPLVSIVIPVYNGSDFLAEAIDSALAQTYQEIEVLVINDGSKDGGKTEKIALSYQDKIRYFSKPNGGVASALNYGISQMKGDYFSWLSHDDLYREDKVSKEMELLIESKKMNAIVISDFTSLINETGATKDTVLNQVIKENLITESVITVLLGMVHGCTLLIPKMKFYEIGMFDESLKTTQDYELWFRLFNKSELLYANESLVICRKHENQGSRTIPEYSAERHDLHIGFVDKLEVHSMEKMFGSEYNGLYQMSRYFSKSGLIKAKKEMLMRLSNMEMPSDVREKLNKLDDYITGITNNQRKDIYLFGTGAYGRNYYEELSDKLIDIKGFIDNNTSKHGYITDGKYCIGVDELVNEKERCLIIVTVAKSKAIIDQLEMLNFPYVITIQELDKILKDTPPMKWKFMLSNIETLDYNSEGVKELISTFNSTIFDLCKYYEGQISILNSEKDNR